MYHGLVNDVPRLGNTFTRPWYKYYQIVVIELVNRNKRKRGAPNIWHTPLIVSEQE